MCVTVTTRDVEYVVATTWKLPSATQRTPPIRNSLDNLEKCHCTSRLDGNLMCFELRENLIEEKKEISLSIRNVAIQV